MTLGPVLLRDMKAGLQELSQQYCEVTLSLGFGSHCTLSSFSDALFGHCGSSLLNLSLVLTSDPLTSKPFLSCFSAFHYPSPAHQMACLMSSCGPDFQDPGVKEGYPWAQLLGRGRVPVQAGYCPSPSSAVSSYQTKSFCMRTPPHLFQLFSPRN